MRFLVQVGQRPEIAPRIDFSPQYWTKVRKPEQAAARYAEIRRKINAAADPKSTAWREIQQLLSH